MLQYEKHHKVDINIPCISLYLFRTNFSNEYDRLFVVFCIQREGYDADKTNVCPWGQYKLHHTILKILLLLP